MKKLLAIVSLLTFAFLLSAQAPKQTEYDLGACGGHSFTVQHAVFTDKKIIFDYFLADPQTALKDDDNLVFDYKAEPKDKDGDVKFHGETKVHGKTLELNGLINGKKIIAILLVDGELGHVFYGAEGKVDDLVKLGPEHYQFCSSLQSTDIKEIPAALAKWFRSESDKSN